MKKQSARKSSSRRPAPKHSAGGALIKRDTEQLQLSPPKPDRARILERAHPVMVAGVPYGLLTERLTADNGELCALAPLATLTFIEEMHPRDPLERLALSQVLLTHARACWLTELMTRQTEAATLSSVSEAAERAATTLTRLTRSLREYRAPMTATVSIAQVGQANLGHGQVVQNVLNQEVPQKNKSVEQTSIASSGDTAEAKTLHTINERSAVTAGQHPANSAMAKELRPHNRRGKGTSRRKRTKARRKKRQSHCAAKTDDGDN
jgi:hypothetical protein